MSGGVVTAALAAGLGLAALLLLAQTWRLRRREAELAAAAAALARQESLVSLGRLMAGIAHELNTPLGAVCCSVGTQQKAVDHLAEAVAQLQQPGADAAAVGARLQKVLGALRGTSPVLDEALGRTNALLREMRLAGRGETPAPEPVDVNALVRTGSVVDAAFARRVIRPVGTAMVHQGV